MLKLRYLFLASMLVSPFFFYFEEDELSLDSLLTYDETEIVAKDPVLRRALTDGEKELVQHTFDQDIDTSQLTITHYDERHEKLSSNVIGHDEHNINIYGNENYADDFSNTESLKAHSSFIFGLTRIWQNQNDVIFPDNASTDISYPLDSKTKFYDLGPYQQAAAVSDYSSRFMHEAHDYIYASDKYGERSCDIHHHMFNLIDPVFEELRNRRKVKELRQQRKFTPGELNVARLIFPGQLNEKSLRQQLSPIDCSDHAAHVDTYYEATYFKSYHEEDYTKPSKVFNFGAFVHELTHIWQRQTDYNHTNTSYVQTPDKYAYSVNNDYKFSDYSVEEQASIIQDYALVFMFGDKALRTTDYEGLKILVERQFPHLEQVRIYYAEHGKLPSAEALFSDKTKNAAVALSPVS